MRNTKRLFYAVVGVLVMLCAGFVYAWSILSAPIAADFPQWTGTQLSLVFTVCMSFFCLGGMGAGILSRRVSVRLNMIFSAALFLAGFVLASRADSLPILSISYGVLCGTASGFAYNSVMSVIPRWFPGRQGLISGVLLLGFGTSSMMIGSVFTALTPDRPGGWRATLLILGVCIAVIIFLCSFFFASPNAENLTFEAEAAPPAAGSELPPGQMVRRPCFWLFFLWAVLLSAVGLIIIGQARNIALTAASSIHPGTLSFAVGLISVCNGLGRVLFGGLFDKFGRKFTMLLVVGCYIVGPLLLWLSLRGSFALLAAGFIFTGLGYGGGPTMSAAVTREFFGQKYYSVNFSIMNLSLLASSFAATVAGGLYDLTGGFSAVFLFMLACVAAASFAMARLSRI